MKLVELVSFFRKGGTFELFCLEQSLDKESEVIEVYMQKPFALDNDLMFFQIEETEGSFEYSFMGVPYFNLFDFYFFLDAIAESKERGSEQLSDHEIAQKLYSYAIHDA